MSEFTPGPWEWWTSNSWKRLKRDAQGITQNVLEPYVCSDGHPDVTINEHDMALIAAAPAMHKLLVGLVSLGDGGSPIRAQLIAEANEVLAQTEGKE